ncbi:MAG: trypsin-like peptidase domain-containing protein [Lachnospiraceae bacterium]|nr:trypsin-like peptidase domain-containing protein [Lachnospiraceae bacterium]
MYENNQNTYQAGYQTPPQNTYQAYSQYAQQVPPQQEPQPPQPSPKKHATASKLLMSVCMGLLFGIFAGVGLYTVRLVTPAEVPAQAGAQAVTSGTASTAAPAALPDMEELQNLLSNGETQVTVLTKEETDLTGVVADVMPSMVSITEHYTISTTYWGQTYTQDGEGSGSGIIIGETDDEYIIVTNNHVVEDANDLEITFIDNTTAPAYLKGLDASTDVAVIAVMKEDLDDETMDTIKVAELGDSDSLVLGQNVIAIGNALGYGQSVTTGIVSALDREITTSDGNTQRYIQTDAAINPGNSGGALLNMAGQVVGINSNKMGGESIEGMGYAIPITAVRETIEEFMGRDTLIEVDEDDMGFIGIYMQEVTEQISKYYGIPVGIYVSEVVEGSGAENAGIIAGDVVVGVNGSNVKSIDSLMKLMKYYAIGDNVDITFMRNEGGEYVEHTVTVTLGEKP